MSRINHKRGEDPVAGEILAKIPALKSVLAHSSKIALDKTKGDSAGFMFLSRYNKGVDESPKIREKAHKVASTEEGEEVERGIQPKETEPTANTGNNYEKKKRYALSLATLASKPSKRLVIVNEGAITVLIELSAIYDKAIQVRCASAFASLSVESKIRARMLDEGALASIISLATNSNIREVKTDCARAICNLCCEKGYEFKMVKEGVPYVVTHVASTCPDTFEICLKILMNITCVTDKFARIEDITEALMYFINSNITLTYDQELLLLTSFRNLASLKNNQLRLVEDGCLKIIDRFFQSSHPKFRKISCEILKFITMDWKTHSKLLEQNILNILLLMYHDRDEDIKILCIKSFLYLSEDYNFRKQIVNGVAIKYLLNITIIKQSNQKNIDIYQIIAKTLRLLCADYNLAYKLVENGISQTLITLIRCNNNLIHQYCAEALCGLFQTTEILDKLIQQGAAQELIKLTYQTNNPHSCEWCSFALYQLSKGNIYSYNSSSNNNDHNSNSSDGDGNNNNNNTTTTATTSTNNNEITTKFYESILPCIIYLCELEYSTDITKRFCSAAFSHLTLSKFINCSNAIPLLVKMLRNENNQIIKKYCASSLFNLADNNQNCYKMLDSQALLPVVELTQNPYYHPNNIISTTTNQNHTSSTSTGDNGNDPKVICAGIISRLSLHKQYYDQFLNGNVLKVLLELSSVDHRLTQRRVVIALSNLSQNEELKLKLLDLNPIPYIISLASERDEYLRRGCISIVCNMSYIPGSEKAIVQAGIIPTLMITSLITSDQITSKIICVKALTNLMANRSQIKSMVKDGIIWGLSKLAQIDNIEMLTLCANALRVLSYNFSKEMLSSNVAIKTLLCLINTNDIKLMLSGAYILTNILLKTNSVDEQFHKLIVDNMLPLAKSNNKELNKLCVICLCLASQSESCRTGIVSSGMLQMIDSNTIFSDPIVSYSYITMFSNIANNPNMRSKVLDMHLIERFERICESNMLHLQIAVAKALYCLSCSIENIPKLIDQNIIPMIKTMAEYNKNVPRRGSRDGSSIEHNNSSSTSTSGSSVISMELLSHLIACLYNLTIVIDIQHTLVSQGFVQIINNIWPDIIKDKDLCLLCYLSICHLACGKTNTTQMVTDNCTNILCFISEYRKNNLYRNYNFTIDIHYRCSAAFRNLLAVVSNQSIMVEHGCLDTIIYLANFSTKERNLVYNPNDPSSGNFRGIWRNCSVALNSLTYNYEIRDQLISSDAINIILRNAEVDNGDISLGQGLLKELEAESWDNGARGRHKEGRSKLVKPSKLYTELLRGGSTVKLDFTIEDQILEKYCVQVQLDEPELMNTEDTGAVITTIPATSAEGTGTTTAAITTTTIGGERLDDTDITALNEVEVAHAAHLRYQAIAAAHSAAPAGPSNGDPQLRLHDPKGIGAVVDKELSIEVLHPYDDNSNDEDGFNNTNNISYTFEKQECNMDTETITLFRIDDNVEETTSIISDELPQESTSTSFPIANGNIPGKVVTTSSQNSFKLYDHTSNTTMNSNSIVTTDSSLETATNKKMNILPNLGKNAIASMFYKESTTPGYIPPPIHKSMNPTTTNNNNTYNNTNTTANMMLPPLIDTNQQLIMKQKKEKFNRSLTKNIIKASPKEEEFKNIVGMIKEAKEGKTASIDDVVNKWKSVSRF